MRNLLILVAVFSLHFLGNDAHAARTKRAKGRALSSACSKTSPLPSSFIYKKIGSHHFTDCRRNTAGLVRKSGATGPSARCVDIVDTNGKSLAKLGFYQSGNGWRDRFYACHGCGRGTPLNGAAIARKAQRNTKSKNIYLDFGSQCYGPILADKCYNSVGC